MMGMMAMALALAMLVGTRWKCTDTGDVDGSDNVSLTFNDFTIIMTTFARSMEQSKAP